MEVLSEQKALFRDPLTWAADCRTYAKADIEPATQAAFTQLAEEFEALAMEIEGLVATFEALLRVRRTA